MPIYIHRRVGVCVRVIFMCLALSSYILIHLIKTMKRCKASSNGLPAASDWFAQVCPVSWDRSSGRSRPTVDCCGGKVSAVVKYVVLWGMRDGFLKLHYLPSCRSIIYRLCFHVYQLFVVHRGELTNNQTMSNQHRWANVELQWPGNLPFWRTSASLYSMMMTVFIFETVKKLNLHMHRYVISGWFLDAISILKMLCDF